jgi:hypothetical protein
MATRSAPSWHAQAEVTEERRMRWRRGENSTGWTPCGRDWDVLAIRPLNLGLEALTAMRLSPRRGYPVLADHVRDTLYVMVEPGTGATAVGAPGVRVLSAGAELLVPYAADGSPCAHWVSPPRDSPPPLLRADRIRDALQRLTATPACCERALS